MNKHHRAAPIEFFPDAGERRIAKPFIAVDAHYSDAVGPERGGGGADVGLDVGEGHAAVDAGLARPEHVQVGAVEEQDAHGWGG